MSSSDARILLYSTQPLQREIFALSIDSGEKRLAVSAATPMLARPRFSPDSRWIAFLQRNEAAWRIYVAPYDGTVKREDQWIAITDGRVADLIPEWSPSGTLLYFYSERDGNLCIWAQQLDPKSKHPVGTPFGVKHFHEARQSLKNVPLIELGMSLTHDRIILNQGAAKGNIWMADYVTKRP
jgi:Tol biopolymer transport system component